MEPGHTSKAGAVKAPFGAFVYTFVYKSEVLAVDDSIFPDHNYRPA